MSAKKKLICIDCKHHRQEFGNVLCAHPKVKGKTMFGDSISANVMREYNQNPFQQETIRKMMPEICGYKGNWFEPK